MDSATAITSIAAVASIASEAADIIFIIVVARGTLIACTRRDIYDSTVLVVVVMIAFGLIVKVCVINGTRWIFTGVRLSILCLHLNSSFNHRLLTHEVSKDEADREGLFVVKHVSFLSFCDRYL